MNDQEVVKRQLAITQSLGFFNLMWVVLFAIVVYKLHTTADWAAHGVGPDLWLRLSFFGLSFLAVAASGFFKRKILNAPVPSTQGQTRILALSTKLSKATLVAFALAELPAINAIGLFFLTGNKIDSGLLIFLSLGASIFYFPRYAQWEEWIRARSPQP